MSGWVAWAFAGGLCWLALSALAVLALGRITASEQLPAVGARAEPGPRRRETATDSSTHVRRRILVVDDDAGFRLLLRVTLGADEYVVEEASSAEEAASLARFWRPDLVVLDVGLPGMDGLEFCRRLTSRREGAPRVILLTGSEMSEAEARAAGAASVLHKPFSPLELVGLIERLPGRDDPFAIGPPPTGEAQLLAYARDLSRLVQIERTQRRLLQHAYRQTVGALAEALEAKDHTTGLHALRVQRYAVELAEAIEPRLLDDPSLEYGFILHDIGKIGIPDRILTKPGPLDPDERRQMQQHPVIGAEILDEVALLAGDGIRVVRSHHERWDGGGYPDGLRGRQIPLGARIFAVADALDAMTNDRPYRRSVPWEDAVEEIVAQQERQFDPDVVRVFADREPRLRRIHDELATAAA